MRFFTCTPVAFGGGPDFFARDSGLLCRGFQALGIESRAVMPGDRKPEDEEDLIRTDYSNLESVEWWKSQKLDGVVLYAWGSPRYRKIAKAIHQAGIFLVLNQDNGGLISPLAGFVGWWKEQWILSGAGKDLVAWCIFVKRVFFGLTIGLCITDPLRAAHLEQGDVIACVSPTAANHYRKLCRIYGGSELAGKITVLPHAVEPIFQYRAESPAKQKQIVCVGRWQDRLQKRPKMMQEVLGQILQRESDLLIEIIGEQTVELTAWHESLGRTLKSRVILRGKVDRKQLAMILKHSQIFYSPSAFESFGIAGGEALCSGCSVVAGRSVSMGSFEWFVSEKSGVLTSFDTIKGHVEALSEEIMKWQNGYRNPREISKVWSDRLHTDKVAMQILKMHP